MAGGKFTDKAIKNAKPGERLTILSDGGGLQLWLTPAGGKLWNYAYRFGGKRRKLAIGPYGKEPAGIPLEAARRRRDEAVGLLREGVDPSTRKRQVKAARAEANANTFEVVADELLDKKKRQIHCNRCGDPWVDRPRVMFAKSTEEMMQELRPPYRLLADPTRDRSGNVRYCGERTRERTWRYRRQ